MLPGWGLSQKLPRLIGVARAKEISFSGNAIDAATAYDWGLVNRVVAPEELLSTCLALARDMASCVPHVLRGYKRLIDDGYGMPLPEALAFERRVAIESAKATSAATIASRRGEVQKRGRER
jgi:enoyl-CoA hydratase